MYSKLLQGLFHQSLKDRWYIFEGWVLFTSPVYTCPELPLDLGKADRNKAQGFCILMFPARLQHTSLQLYHKEYC